MEGSANWSACSFFAFLQVPHQLHFIIAIKTLSWGLFYCAPSRLLHGHVL